MFNIDLCDLFFDGYSSDFENVADYITSYECGPTRNEVRNNLETTAEKIFEWVILSNLKTNSSKCHLFISPCRLCPANVSGFTIENRNCAKLLGIYMDSNFSFEYHINRICHKAS